MKLLGYLFGFLLLLCCTSSSNAQCQDCNSLDEALKDPLNVKSIKINATMHGIHLDSIPIAIAQCKNLKILYLSDHQFTSIPKEIGELQKLKELSLAGSKLSKLPDEIFTLKQLSEIILFDNNFSEEYKELLRNRFKKDMPKTKLLMD
ncbi:MAG: leucine-rich repeat domain-containing protein [Bacteroidetes bacterium]|nr:leucine-rich repeat domain-containing protein [Bacteroidota bacterium]